jgi:predicted AAA+ superfamily ATPase
VIFRIAGMSFREYLLFNDIEDIQAVSFETLLRNRKKIESGIAGIKKIKGYFKNYLENGYYPFVLEDTATYHQKILRVIEKTVYEDIAGYYHLKTENLSNFKRILAYLATIPPGELNRNSIAKNIGLDNKTIQNYLNILKETGLIELISENKSGSNLLKQKEKIYLDNPDIYKAIIDEIGYKSEIGTIREVFFIKMIRNSGNEIHVGTVGDFVVDNTLFEIGGRSKNRKQIKNNLPNAFLVKDDILYGSKDEIPLYLFGFLY